jgi:hypothetical protein
MQPIADLGHLLENPVWAVIATLLAALATIGVSVNDRAYSDRRVLVRLRTGGVSGAFSAPGHDKTAESAVIKVDYGTVPDFLKAHGYRPDGKSPSLELAKFKKRGGEYLQNQCR